MKTVDTESIYGMLHVLLHYDTNRLSQEDPKYRELIKEIHEAHVAYCGEENTPRLRVTRHKPK